MTDVVGVWIFGTNSSNVAHQNLKEARFEVGHDQKRLWKAPTRCRF